MNNQVPNTKKYDLEERTAKFGEEVINFVKQLPRDEITKPLITQLVKSATSVGANFCEADDAESGKEEVRHCCKRQKN